MEIADFHPFPMFFVNIVYALVLSLGLVILHHISVRSRFSNLVICTAAKDLPVDGKFLLLSKFIVGPKQDFQIG